MIVSTDASRRGWGASFLHQKTGGLWQKEESRAHINVLELKAANLALQALVKGPRHIQLLTDNSTAVSYINKQGGTHSPSLVAQELIWNFCISKNIWLTANHVPGVNNIEADFASRNLNNRTEWTLDRKVFQKITNQFCSTEVDLFASRINNLLQHYVARHPDPGSIATDAFLQDWGQ
jgi:ribonuclease HI